MKTIAKTENPRARSLIKALALGGVLMVALAPCARADVRHDRDWRGHERYAHDHWHHAEYGAVYAPPVVYSPPPVYQSPGLNLVIPLHIH